MGFRLRRTRAHVCAAIVLGLCGFGVGWFLCFSQVGWPVGLLISWWPALMLGAACAWVVGIGLPELGGILTKTRLGSVHPRQQGQDRQAPTETSNGIEG